MTLKTGLARDSLRNLSTSSNVVDNFEDDPDGTYGGSETLDDYYSGDLSHFERTQSDVANGSYALKNTDTNGARRLIVSDSNGLISYPYAGNTVRSLLRDPSGGTHPGMGVAAQVTNLEMYAYHFEPNRDKIVIRKWDDSTSTGSSTLSSASINESTQTYYWVEGVVPENSGSSKGDLSMTLYNYDAQNDARGSEIQNVTANDTDYVDNDGVGFAKHGNDPGAISDDYFIK